MGGGETKEGGVYMGCRVNIELLHLYISNLIEYVSLLMVFEPHCEKTGLPGFPTRSDTNRAV